MSLVFFICHYITHPSNKCNFDVFLCLNDNDNRYSPPACLFFAWFWCYYRLEFTFLFHIFIALVQIFPLCHLVMSLLLLMFNMSSVCCSWCVRQKSFQFFFKFLFTFVEERFEQLHSFISQHTNIYNNTLTLFYDFHYIAGGWMHFLLFIGFCKLLPDFVSSPVI